MDDEKIGDCCHFCKKRDYVPYRCKTCNLLFCNEHYWEK